MTSGIKVKAPATISNLACGFDVLGAAIHLTADELIGRLVQKPGVHINRIYGVKKALPTNPDENTAGVAIQSFLRFLRADHIGIELNIYKKLPIGTGLGSSASSAAAGVMLANELLKRPLTKRELVPFSILGELAADGALHGDNVIPSLIGGVVFIRDIRSLSYKRVYHPPGLFVSIVFPQVKVLTREARGILSNQVPMKKFVKQTGNLGGLLLGLQSGDFEMIKCSLQDAIIEPQRAHLIPHFYEVQAVAHEAGALGCSISGSGPTIFAFSDELQKAEIIAQKMHRIYDLNKIDCISHVSTINEQGTVLC